MNVVAPTDGFSTGNSKADGSSQRTYKRLVDYSTHRDDTLGKPDFYSWRRDFGDDDDDSDTYTRQKTIPLHLAESHAASIHAAVSSLRSSRTSGESAPPVIVSSLRSSRTCGHAVSRRLPLLTPSRKSLDSTANFGTIKQSTTKSGRRSRRSTHSTALSSSVGSRLALVGNYGEDAPRDIESGQEKHRHNDSFCTAIVHSTNIGQDFSIDDYEGPGGRLSKMNWLANNVSKRNIRAHIDVPPRVLKVIYPNDENKDVFTPEVTTNHATRNLSVSESDWKDASQRSRNRSRRSSCRRRTSGTATTMSSSSNAAPQLSASKTRRSSASFVAGSRIRIFNVGL